MIELTAENINDYSVIQLQKLSEIEQGVLLSDLFQLIRLKKVSDSDAEIFTLRMDEAINYLN